MSHRRLRLECFCCGRKVKALVLDRNESGSARNAYQPLRRARPSNGSYSESWSCDHGTRTTRSFQIGAGYLDEGVDLPLSSAVVDRAVAAWRLPDDGELRHLAAVVKEEAKASPALKTELRRRYRGPRNRPFYYCNEDA